MWKLLFVLSAASLIIILSCGTPNDPESVIGGDGGYKIIGRYITTGFAQDLVIDDTLAYIAQGEDGFMIASIKNPDNPKFVSEFSNVLDGYIYKIAKKDSAVFLAAGGYGIHIVNVGDPVNPKIGLASLHGYAPGKNFYMMDDFLFTAKSENGIIISKLDGGINLAQRLELLTPGYAQGVCTSFDNNYLLVADGETGLSIMDISDFQDGWGGLNGFPLVARLKIPGYAEAVIVDPDLPVAFLTCGSGGIAVVDFSDINNLKLIGSYNTGGYAKEIIYQDKKVFVTTELRGLQIFDVTNPSSPVRIGTVQTQYALGLAIDENCVYVADEKEGLVIISIP